LSSKKDKKPAILASFLKISIFFLSHLDQSGEISQLFEFEEISPLASLGRDGSEADDDY